ncbi:hypothetical protein C882_0928 [Caenispirillum salinarum AK4]|uniref:DUF4168 domain-containing protein n=1 Tax=Caenispirillum salinarum AK4 TaxID=1238182 RepID=K9HJE4_9PROT|nr:DUF4168 domain-containing protein [Caenispirillum salinarum]EKV28716.1 hypothetical protein C882_0928 [Caenispirillum salinarum AK4]
MRSMMKRFALPMVSAALFAAPAAAQTQGETPMQGQGQMQMQGQGQMATDFSEDKLKSFAEAVEGIQQVARDYAPRLRDAENPQQVADLEQQAQDEMLQTVQDEGLTVEEYNQIAVAAQTDPQLAEEIQGYMAEGTGAAGGGQSD